MANVLEAVELLDPSLYSEQPDEQLWLPKLLEIVRQRKGLDFSGYRISTLLRRVHNRMIAVNARTFAEYWARLRDEPAEAEALVQKITIKVSRFFRDVSTFETLQLALETRRNSGGPLACWSAGCGQGEEAYSLAILLHELGAPATGTYVLGTDIDPLALAHASDGCYPVGSLQGVCERRATQYFAETTSRKGRQFRVCPEIRSMVDLQFHDLTTGHPPQSPPFDLVCCRNVLIYFDLPLQRRVLKHFERSLVPGGLLCLGEAEWILPQMADRFEVVDRKSRLFKLRERR